MYAPRWDLPHRTSEFIKTKKLSLHSSRPKSYLFRHTGDMAQMQALEAV
jgi:hypothetical protein